MARNPVTPVIPVDPVGEVRPVYSGSTYFRHLEQWQFMSEFNAAERRRKQRKRESEQKPDDGEFKKMLIESAGGSDEILPVRMTSMRA